MQKEKFQYICATMLHVKRVFYLIVFLSCYGFATAQNNCEFTFEGTVIDNHDDQPLVGAVVRLNDTSVKITDENGKFSFENLCKQNYNLNISHIDCEPLNETILLNNSISRRFYLEHHEQYLEEITIETQRRKAEQSKAIVTVTEEEIQQKQGKAYGDLLEGVQGVNLLKTGSTIAKPIINGLHSQRIVTINQGVRLEGQQWGLEHAPGIDSYSVQQIDVIKGAGTVEYGSDAIGGAIIVNSPSLPDQYGYKIAPTLSYFSNGQNMSGAVAVEGKQKVAGIPLSFTAQGSIRKAGNLQSPNYFLDNTGVNEQNFLVSGGYVGDDYGVEVKASQFNSELGILTDSHIGNASDLLAIIENGQPFVDRGFSYDINRPRQDILHEIIEGNGYLRTKWGKLEASVARQYNKRDEYDRFNDVPGLSLKTQTYTGKLSLDHSLGDSWNGKIGIDGLLQDYAFNGFYLIPEYEYGQFGAYISESLQLNDGLLVEGGLRWDAKEYRYELPFNSFDEVDESEIDYESKGAEIGYVKNRFQNLWSGSGGASLELTEDLLTSVYVGFGVRQPLPNELFSDGVHHGTALYEVGTPTLENEYAKHVQINVSYFANDLRADFHAYSNHINDYIYLRPDENLGTKQTIRGAFPIHRFTQEDAVITGFDFSLVKDVLSNKIQLSTQGTFLWGTNTSKNEPLIYMPQNKVLLGGNYNATNLWEFGLQYQHVFEQKRLPESIEDFGTIPDGYGILNASISKETAVLDHPLVIRANVENGLNTSYKNYLDRFRYFAEAPGVNFGIQLNYLINKTN